MNTTQTLTRVLVSHIQPMFSNTLSPLISSSLSHQQHKQFFSCQAKTLLMFCLPGHAMADPVLFMKSLFNFPLQLGLNSNGEFNYIREVSSLFLNNLLFTKNLFLSWIRFKLKVSKKNIKQYSEQYVCQNVFNVPLQLLLWRISIIYTCVSQLEGASQIFQIENISNSPL